MSKRDSIEELDGNAYEAFSKIPEDCRLPVNILSKEVPIAIPDYAAQSASNLGNNDEESVDTELKTDLTKGIFITKAYISELGTTTPKDKVAVSIDPASINMGEYVSEKMENIVWPCKESKELCKSKEFNESKG